MTASWLLLVLFLAFLSGASAWAALVTYLTMVNDWRPQAIGAVASAVLAVWQGLARLA